MTFSLDRVITIHARRPAVFRFFTDSERWARWWGAGSTIEPRAGGAVRIVYPNGVRVSGEVREVVAVERIAFTYGYDSGTPFAAGATLVTITLADVPGGTRLELRHDLADAAARDAHVHGWRHQLAVFGHVVTDDALAGEATEAIAAWFAAWRDPAGARALLATACTDDVRFRDAHADVRGLDELAAHVAALARFLPGVTFAPTGATRRGADVALVDWVASRADGTRVMAGTNVVRLSPDGKIADVVGISA